MKRIVMILLVLSVVSCKTAMERDMLRFIGSRVCMNDGLKASVDSVFEAHGQCRMVLVLYNEMTNNCLPCSFSNIRFIDMCKSEFSEMGLEPVVVVGKNSSFPAQDIIKSIRDDMGFDYPVVFDDSGYMLSENPVLRKYDICRTFVIDRDGTVLWLGNPAQNSRTLDLFKQHMQ